MHAAEPLRSDAGDEDERFIARLYRSVPAVAPEQFRVWALGQLRERIPFDGAFWAAGSGADWQPHTLTRVDLPASFIERLRKWRSMNPMAERLLMQPNAPHRMEDVFADDRFFASDLFRRVFQPQGIHRILSVMHLDPRTGLNLMIALYRRDREQPFTAEEQARHRRFVLHLFQASSHSFFAHLWMRRRQGPLHGAMAVVDRMRHFHEVQPEFLALLERHLGKPLGQTLPLELPPPGVVKPVGELCVCCEPLGDLTFIHLWPQTEIDRLTIRERQIAVLVAGGLNYKKIARTLGTAPSTVYNNLYRVYRKLGIRSREELSARVRTNPSLQNLRDEFPSDLH